MFKKTQKRNIRHRKRNDSDNDPSNEAEKNAENDVASNAVKKKNDKPKKKTKEKVEAKSTSLLSFGDDGEEDVGETFKLKKSSRSRRIAKQIKKLAQEEKERSEVVAPGTAGYGHYTKENLEKLRLEMKQAPMFNSEVESVPEPQSFTNEPASNMENVPGLRPGEIPTPAAIHAARKQRELYRKYGNEYIAVDDTDRFKDNNSKSRLVRDDDNDASGSDGEEANMQMKGVIDEAEKMSREIVDDIDSDHRDDEINRWEQQLIRTGQGFQQIAPDDQPQVDNQTNGHRQPHQFYMSTSSDNSTANKFSSSPTQTLMNVRKRVKERLAVMKEVNYGHERECEKIKLENEESEISSKNLVNTKQLETHYHFFQLIHNYVRDLIDCLNEKLPDIEDAEEKVHKIWSEQAQKLLERRRADISDESADANALASGGKPATDNEKQARIRERDARRTRRKAMRQVSGTKDHNNGMSTDEEETTSDVAKYSSTLQDARNYIESIFEDVVDEFHNIKHILEKFNDWRTKFPASYNDAYIGLCLPKILGPFVRMKIIHWNPVLLDSRPLEEADWFSHLMQYAAGIKRDNTNELEAIHQDERIIPILFEKVIMPKLVFIITEVWDPMSSRQTVRLIDYLESIVNIYPCTRKDNKRFQGLIVSICARIQHAIDNDIFIPLLPAMSLVNITSGPGAFLERQTWSSLKLFKNILLFHDILSQNSLHELAFDSILNRYIILALQTAPVTSGSVMKCQFIATSIPSAWLEPEENNLQGHLLAMCKYLLHAANQIHTHMEASSYEQRGKDCMKQISRILYHIGEEEFSEQVDKLIWNKTTN